MGAGGGSQSAVLGIRCGRLPILLDRNLKVSRISIGVCPPDIFHWERNIINHRVGPRLVSHNSRGLSRIVNLREILYLTAVPEDLVATQSVLDSYFQVGETFHPVGIIQLFRSVDLMVERVKQSLIEYPGYLN